ncbi:MAG TPA: hypothetical protein VKB83_01045 [Nitrosopumilaceae archaeon]|nr:hypothetical protein [Nitrosopumilaceae archaeon]
MLITDDCQKMKLVKKLALNGIYLQTLEKDGYLNHKDYEWSFHMNYLVHITLNTVWI